MKPRRNCAGVEIECDAYPSPLLSHLQAWLFGLLTGVAATLLSVWLVKELW